MRTHLTLNTHYTKIRVWKRYTNKKMKDIELKIELIRKGYTNKAAACALGINRNYLSNVLNGRYESRRLRRRIHALPDRNRAAVSK